MRCSPHFDNVALQPQNNTVIAATEPMEWPACEPFDVSDAVFGEQPELADEIDPDIERKSRQRFLGIPQLDEPSHVRTLAERESLSNLRAGIR